MLRLGSAVGARRHRSGARSDSPQIDAATSAQLHEAAWGLATRRPELSATTTLWHWQKVALAGLGLSVVSGALLAPDTTLAVLLGLMALPFLCVVVLRTAAVWHLIAHRPPPEEPSLRIEPHRLPLYTVLVPLYREASVIPQLLVAIEALDYPITSLQIFLVVEANDTETHAALRAATLLRHMSILVVPDGAPRTKPRAIQYALQFAHGDYVVVYDAEDLPEPDQLRRALAVLLAGPRNLGCLQAHLNIYNSGTSWLTRGIMAQTPGVCAIILLTRQFTSSTRRYSTASCPRSSTSSCRCHWEAPPTISAAMCSRRSAAGTPTT